MQGVANDRRTFESDEATDFQRGCETCPPTHRGRFQTYMMPRRCNCDKCHLETEFDAGLDSVKSESDRIPKEGMGGIHQNPRNRPILTPAFESESKSIHVCPNRPRTANETTGSNNRTGQPYSIPRASGPPCSSRPNPSPKPSDP